MLSGIHFSFFAQADEWIPAFAGMTVIKISPLHKNNGIYIARMEKRFFVYILASGHYGTLYTGMTSNLSKRIWEHKSKALEGFSKQYNVSHLVYYEPHETFESAVLREKKIKSWKRQWKINLIEQNNPHWDDLSLTMETV